MADCPFCKRIAAREYDMRNQWAVAFEPLNPVTAGHRLVVPTVHVKSAMTDPVVTGAVMEFAVIVARAYGVRACNLITSAGPAATQTISHLHIHIVPRREGDGLALPWTGQSIPEVTE